MVESLSDALAKIGIDGIPENEFDLSSKQLEILNSLNNALKTSIRHLSGHPRLRDAMRQIQDGVYSDVLNSRMTFGYGMYYMRIIAGHVLKAHRAEGTFGSDEQESETGNWEILKKETD